MSSSPAPPSFFYFDLGNVLLYFSHEQACTQVAEVAGISSERVQEIIFESGLQWRYERGQIDCDAFHQEFCQASSTTTERAPLELAGSAIFEFNHSITPILEALTARGQRLGVLSNTCAAHWRYATDGRYAALGQHFEVYALSFEMGTAKPEPEIYHAAAELAGVPATEIFFTDDRPENIEAAREAGFDAVLFTGSERLAADLNARGVKIRP